MIGKILSVPTRVRPVRAWWQGRGLALRDGAVGAVFLLLAFTPGVAHEGLNLAELARRPLDPLGSALLLAQCLPLVARRSRPVWCLAGIAAAYAVHELLGYPSTFASESLLVALYSVGAYQERHRRTLAVVGTTGYAALAVVFDAQGSPEQPIQFVTFYLVVILGCWAAGTWMRSRTRQEAERRRHTAESAITRERARIARELHDVVTHHVTAMVIQADAAQFLVAGEPEQAVSNLSAISDTGRRTLAELRYFLGVLDPVPEADRAPAVGRLEDLVEQTRSAGQPVELNEVGERRPMTHGAELAAYRVVQESLTNALKHAPGRRTVVRVRHDAAQVDIEVSTDGTGNAVSPTAHGRGLTGLRERVSVVGGELLADGRPDGGFTVRARIPAESGQ
ncbi:sensor histidine kinase [Actinomadura sp. DC4]|uniref:sensor histidine kinase n=1 Tax=Actinomadura sp. DC4 TaxID=3055069 RepID=UPI0025B11B6B|nr:sensor histidine kinase [Actinomadura sp. DC4]MDN3354869.1 sensor histidine kinase [Actinomadura sp. DC4]